MLKVVLVGKAKCGKTSLVNQFIESRFEEKYEATLGADFRTKLITIEEKLVKM